MYFSYKDVEKELDCFIDHTNEHEQHKLFSLFENFYDERVGWHTYYDGKRIYGYYENGTKTRLGDLQHSKVWMLGRVKNKSEIKGVVIFSPFLATPVFFTIILTVLLFLQGSISFWPFLFGEFILTILGASIIKDTTKACRSLFSFFDHSMDQ